ncbi:MAG: cupredoxin family copper-binding protein [Erythrobacter sp.]|jgi:plastocyanin
MAGVVAWPSAPASGKDAVSPRVHVVEIRHFRFYPARLEVKAGDVITWKNFDAAPHTATAKGWDSGRLNHDQSWSLKVTGKGTVDYVCTYHPAMKGRLVVA